MFLKSKAFDEVAFDEVNMKQHFSKPKAEITSSIHKDTNVISTALTTELLLVAYSLPAEYMLVEYLPLSEDSVSVRTTPGSTDTPGRPDRGRDTPT